MCSLPWGEVTGSGATRLERMLSFCSCAMIDIYLQTHVEYDSPMTLRSGRKNALMRWCFASTMHEVIANPPTSLATTNVLNTSGGFTTDVP